MISVCMTSHNGGKYIKEQIDSILSQLGDADELIISDDGSTDNSIDIIRSYSDHRIKLFTYKQQKDYSSRYLSAYYYASANFNNALIHAQGDYIFLSDQDDVWMPNKVECCMEALQRCDIVSHNFAVIDAEGILQENKHLDDATYMHLHYIDYWKYFPFRGCCLAFNRKAYKLSVPLPHDTFEHDCWIGMNGLMHGLRFQYLPEALICYRRHVINVSELQSPNSLFFKLRYRGRLLWKIICNW